MQLDAKLEELKEKVNKKPPVTRELQIIIVEDELPCYLLIEEALHFMNLGCLSIHAENAEKAIKILEESKRPTSLIILDLLMEGMGGVKFLSWLTSHPVLSMIPTLIITGASEKIISEALQYDGIYAVVHKPFTLSTVTEAVKRIDLTWPLKPKQPARR